MFRAPVDRSRAARIVLLAALVSTLAVIKLSDLPGTGPFGVDGSFYVNAARNVQEGVGLKTNVSMYYFGHTELPTRSRLIYPMWPLLLGYTARATGLIAAVNYLPPFLYLLDLLLLYALTNRMAAAGERQWIVTPGHLAALLLGVNPNFWAVTKYPYTEGLGFLFAFLSLLALDAGQRRSPVVFGMASALFAGLALLTRSQLVIVGIALLITAVWSAVRTRRFPFAAAFTATYAVLFVVWYFTAERVGGSPTVPLPALEMWNRTSAPAEYLRQRFAGVVASLTPFGRYSYFAAFGPAFLLPFIAVALAMARWWRTRPRSLSVSPGAASMVASAFVGLGTYAALNMYHHNVEFFIPWLFGYRHSLPMVLPIAAATAYLMTRGRIVRAVTLLCVGASIVVGVVVIGGRVTMPALEAPSPAERQMIEWLDAHPQPPTILTVRAQHLSVYTRANIHWTECRTPPATSRAMLSQLPIDYVIVYAAETECAFIKGSRDLLAPRFVFGAGAERIYVLERRR